MRNTDNSYGKISKTPELITTQRKYSQIQSTVKKICLIWEKKLIKFS